MQRGQLRRDQAFIDPSTLPTQRPGMSRGNTNLSVPLQNANTQTKSGNRLSKTPLLNFDAPPQGGGMAETRSVFGVDQIWERELEKLKVIQEQERVAGEKRVKEEANKPGKRGKGKKKNSVPTAEPVQQSSSQPAATSRLSTLPPTLPDVKTGLSDIPVTHSDSDEEEEELIPIEKRRESQMTIGAKGWFADSSDDDHPSFGGDGPPRRPSSKAQTRRNTRGASTSEPLPPIQSGVNDGSDEDVPLAAQLSKTPLRAVARPRPRPQADDDDDDDRPLTVLMDSRKSAAGMSSFNLDSGAIGSSRVLGQSSSKKPTGDDDDDEVPLGLRIKPSNNDDEDDKPLGMRFSTAPSMGNLDWQRQQQQQQQFQLMQQQQFMMQQMHNPMTPFAPSMMGPFMPPFGVAPAQSLYMGMPMQPPIATPESSTFGRVERWRHNIGDE